MIVPVFLQHITDIIKLMGIYLKWLGLCFGFSRFYHRLDFQYGQEKKTRHHPVLKLHWINNAELANADYIAFSITLNGLSHLNVDI